MSIESVLQAARAGLTFERLRMDTASRHIAAANVPLAPNATPQGPTFADHVTSGSAPASGAAGTRAVHDPGNPMADAQGMVHYPATDLVGEMTTLLTASRGYEANVRSFNLLRSMMLKALELGAKG
jgi:flagellar basal-body rod protein FlgC